MKGVSVVNLFSVVVCRIRHRSCRSSCFRCCRTSARHFAGWFIFSFCSFAFSSSSSSLRALLPLGKRVI